MEYMLTYIPVFLIYCPFIYFFQPIGAILIHTPVKVCFNMGKFNAIIYGSDKEHLLAPLFWAEFQLYASHLLCKKDSKRNQIQ